MVDVDAGVDDPDLHALAAQTEFLLGVADAGDRAGREHVGFGRPIDLDLWAFDFHDGEDADHGLVPVDLGQAVVRGFDRHPVPDP